MKTIEFVGGPADGSIHHSTAAAPATTWDIPYQSGWDSEGQPVVTYHVAHYILAYIDQFTAIYEYEGDHTP